MPTCCQIAEYVCNKKQTFIIKGDKWKLSAGIKCLRMEWHWSHVRSWGFYFNKSNICENANGYMLKILINEYQVASPPSGRYVAFWNEIRHVSLSKLCHQILSNPDVRQAQAYSLAETYGCNDFAWYSDISVFVCLIILTMLGGVKELNNQSVI